MRNGMRLATLAAGTAVLVCLMAVAVAFAGGDRRVVGKSAGRSVTAHASALQGLERLAPQVAALRAAHGPDDAVDGRLVRSSLLRGAVADAGLARRVGFTKPAWFLPGTDGRSICVLTPASLNCPLSKDVEDQGLAPSMSWTAQGPVRVSGIASDSVTSVDIVQQDGTVESVAVTNNLLDYSSESAPREIRWNGLDGPHTVVLPHINGR
jgi:hypothetical protein